MRIDIVSQKLDHPTDGEEFVKPNRFKILSPLERGVNYKQNPYNNSTTPKVCCPLHGKLNFKFATVSHQIDV